MQRLRGADAFHLYKESRTQHLHTIKVQILDLVGSQAPVDYDELKRTFERGVSVVPPLHWQLVKMPLNFAHPLWRYQRDLDIDYHVRRMHAPAPGGPRELDEVISEIASTGLERDRPLWQLWLVEGLEGGRIAYVTKLHHALADGVSSARILADAFQDSPSADMESPPHVWPEGEPLPARRELYRDGLHWFFAQFRGFPPLVVRTVRAWSISLRRMFTGKPRMGTPFSGPRTRFNQRITPHRWYASVDLPLPEMRRIKEILGGTLNDVYVAICAGALRHYLEERGELPGAPLLASIPVSIREEHEMQDYGNRISTWLVGLATEVVGPIERYRAIQRNTSAARESFEAKDPRLLLDWQEYWWVYRLLEILQRIAARLSGRPVFHVIISNVRGPAKPIYSAGARVVGLRSMGPIVDDAGLNFTGWSYLDTMSVGMVACREHVPDISELAEGVARSLRELRDAAEELHPGLGEGA